MSKSAYIGNVPWRATDADLLTHLRSTGVPVDGVTIMTDRETGRSRGFAFAQVPDDAALQRVIADFNEKEFSGRTLFINEARPREERPPRPPRA